MAIGSPTMLFLAEAGRLLAAEEAGIRLLSELVERAEDTDLRRDLEKHARRSYHHTERLSKALHDLAGVEETAPAPAFDGLCSDLRARLALLEEPSPRGVRDLALIAGTLRIERYEIAAYESLLSLAEVIAPEECDALEETLADERLAAGALERHSARIATGVQGA